MNKIGRAGLRVAGLLMLCVSTLATPARAADWEWTLIPYVWASDIGLDVTINDEPIVSADVGFDDILDNTEVAAQMHFEGRRGKGGFFLDMTFLDLSASQTRPANPPLPGGTQINSDFETILFEAAGFYRPSADTHGLDLLLGVRVVDVDMQINIALPPPLTETIQVDGSDTLTDGFAGARYQAPLGESWLLLLRADVGAGDTEFSWNATAMLGYHFGQRDQFIILGGYRHLEMEFDTDDNGTHMESEFTMSGPGVGFAFRF